MSQIRTVTAPPRSSPIHGMQSAVHLAKALEEALNQRWPDLYPRCVGYTRDASLPITIAFEHAMTLHTAVLSVPPGGSIDALVAQADRVIAERTGHTPRED